MARINFQSMDLFRDIQEDQNLFYNDDLSDTLTLCGIEVFGYEWNN